MNQTCHKDETRKAHCLVELSYGDVKTHLAALDQLPPLKALVYVYKQVLIQALLHSFLTNHQPLRQDTAYIKIHIFIANKTLLLHLLA